MKNTDGKTIEEAVEAINESTLTLLESVQLKCWEQYKSELSSGEEAMTLEEFVASVPNTLYVEQVDFGFINVDRLGGKDFVIEELVKLGDDYKSYKV